MEIILLGIYSFFAWLIFFKFKWLPWNFISQVITITIPIIGLTILILVLNIVAPSSADVRVINYVIPINPQIRGIVVDVPVEPNRPIKKGDLLFKIDPVPFQNAIANSEANIENLKKQLKSVKSSSAVISSKSQLARKRSDQFTELAGSGAGNKFDKEQADTEVVNLKNELASSNSKEESILAQIEAAEAQLADARWQLSQTTFYAPTNGTVVALTLRKGAMAVPLPMLPAMNFIEDEQWILAIFRQNEVRKIKPGQEAEIAFKMYPGRVVKAKVDSIMWATAQGQMPIGNPLPNGGVAPIPPNSLAVRLLMDGKDKELFLAAGAQGGGAIYTDSGAPIHIIRKIILRVGSKIDWLILKLH